MTDDATTEHVLTDWNERLSRALSVPLADVDAVLGLAGAVAHGVVRPAAPLTTYLVGYATGVQAASGASPEEAFAQAVAVARALAHTEPGP